MINNLKHELRKRPTYDELLRQAMTSKLKTVIRNKYNKDMLLNIFNFDEIDLMNYQSKEIHIYICMNAEVMMAVTYNSDDMTKLLGGSSKKFKSKLMNKAEAEALAFTYDPDLYDDDDDDDDDKNQYDDIDKYGKKLLMLMRII